MGEPNWVFGKKRLAVETFFRDAFCAKCAEVLTPSELPPMEIDGIIRIETGDKRGTFYMATLKTIKTPKQGEEG